MPSTKCRRRGLVLVEFAIVAFVLTLLLAAILAFGLLLFGANVAQQAVDVGARELARTPLPFDAEFPELGSTGHSSTDPSSATIPSQLDPSGTTMVPNVFADPDVQSQIFDERYLVVTIGGSGVEDLPANYTRSDVDALLGRMPLLNRLLYSLMIFDSANGVIRYPGALVTNSSTGEQTVLVPLVLDRDDDGRETNLEWRAVVEEVRDGTGVGPHSLVATPTGIEPGFVALRVNYPSQPGTLVAYQFEHSDGSIDGRAELGEDVVNIPVTAEDPAGVDPPSPYSLAVAADSGVGPNAGRFGLGRAFAFGRTVRPFRRVLTMQAVYRREIFE